MAAQTFAAQNNQGCMPAGAFAMSTNHHNNAAHATGRIRCVTTWQMRLGVLWVLSFIAVLAWPSTWT